MQRSNARVFHRPVSGAARLTKDQLIGFGANKFVEKPIRDYAELIKI